MNVNKDRLRTFLIENGIKITEADLEREIKKCRGVDMEFLELFIKYNKVEIDETVVNALAPLPMYSLVIKCPMLIQHYKDGQPFIKKGATERDAVVRVLNKQNYKRMSETDVEEMIEEYNLNMTSKAFTKLFEYIDLIVGKESDEDFKARPLMDKFYSVGNVVNYWNTLSISGKDNYYVYYIKATDENFGEHHMSYFSESLFLMSLAALAKTPGKDVKTVLMMVRPNDVLTSVKWHIPHTFLDEHDTSPEDMLAKFITANFKDIASKINDTSKLVKLTQNRKIKYCDNCGYNYLKDDICKN